MINSGDVMVFNLYSSGLEKENARRYAYLMAFCFEDLIEICRQKGYAVFDNCQIDSVIDLCIEKLGN